MKINLLSQRKVKVMLFFALCELFASTARGQNPTFTQRDIIKKPGVTEDQIFGLSATEKQTTITYYDGMGRAIQTIGVKASPQQKDIIQPVVYNSLGQLAKSLLPYTSNEDNGSYRPNAVNTEQPAFYQNGSVDKVADDASPFSQQVFENSPLQRQLRSGLIGAGFQPTGATGTQHYKTVSYRSNAGATDGNIIIWGPDGTNLGTYADHVLSVTDGTDEDGIEVITFTDLQGKAILKRQKKGTANLDTYYVYNNGGAISYLIPPQATALLAVNSYNLSITPLSNLVFKYSYDSQGRLVERTQPGAGAVYLVYDPLNRPVLIQDARLRLANQWNYIKYDAKDHAVSQGIYTDATNTSRAAMQNYVTSAAILASYENAWYENRSTTAATGYYTNAVFPTTSITPLAYSYYDDYDLDANGSADYVYNVQSLSNESAPTTAAIKGMPTMVRTRTVGTGINNIWLIKVLFYDKYGRIIQTQSNNQLNYAAEKVTDYTTSAPDFTGTPLQTKMVKTTGTATAPVTVSVLTVMGYDHMNRVTAVDQSYNGGALMHIAAYSYNELGQLVKKRLQPENAAANQDVVLDGSNSVASGGNLRVTASNSIKLMNGFVAASGSDFSASLNSGALQSVDYRYNIRGQLLSINNSKLNNDSGTANTNSDSNDLFGMQLLYDQTDSSLGNTPWYNGKLSAVKWMSRDAGGNAGNERSYTYSYDALNQYTGSAYAERTAASTGAFTINLNGFNESGITYDAGGNLLTLKRNAIPAGGGSVTELDNLVYSYDPANPGRLKTVTDGTGSNYTGYGFRNLSGTTTGSYAYDVNGNLTADPYKALTLDYNILNRTDKITITSATGRYMAYTYTATGQLIRKQQYDNNTLQATTDYVDGLIYLNGALSSLNMPEGRLRNTGTGSSVTLKREYVITDQQGNARISFEESTTAPGTAIIRQENSYYGFGLVMPGSVVATPVTDNKQLYNGGAEWQNDFGNLPDYYQAFYRNYDAALGRFIGVDPQPESAESLTGYHYAGNNPIMYNDPLGDRYYRSESTPWYAIPDMNNGNSGWSMGGAAGFGGGGGGAFGPGQTHSNHWLALEAAGLTTQDMLSQLAAGNSSGQLVYSTGDASLPLRNLQDVSGFINGVVSNRIDLNSNSYTFTVRDGITDEDSGRFYESGSYERTIHNSANQGGLKDITAMFDKQLADTRAFFSQERNRLESGKYFPGTVMATRYLFFMEMVKTKAPYDLKNGQYKRSLIGYYSLWHGEKMQFGDYGQINYGVAAKAFGISLEDAIHFAGINQIIQLKPNWNNTKGWFDGPGETELIIRGYNMFK